MDGWVCKIGVANTPISLSLVNVLIMWSGSNLGWYKT